MSELPEGWTWATPSEIADIRPHSLGIGPFGSDLKVSDYRETGTPLVFVRNIRAESFGGDGDRFISATKAADLSAHKVLAGDLLITKMGDPPGDACLYPQGRPPAVMTADCIRLRPNSDICEAKFLMYAARTNLVRQQILVRTTGVAQKKVSLERFASVRFPVAPFREQKRIVEALDSYLTRLDAAAEGLRRVEANLKRYRASVLKAAVEGRLVPTEAALAKREGRSYEPASELLARILKERRRRWEEAELAKMKAKGESPKNDTWKSKYQSPPDPTTLPALPEGWCWATVAQLAADESYSLAIGPFGSNLKVSDYADKGTPLVFVRNIRAEQFSGLDDRYVSASKAHELKAHTVSGGDVLITKMGDPPGDAALYPAGAPDAVITADCIKVRTHPALNAEFVLWMIRSANVQAAIRTITKGVAQKKVSLGRFAGVAIPLAPVAEQTRIVGEIALRQSQAAHAGLTINGVNGRMSRLRQSILTWAFEGKLVDQDPDDEPASVLLDRIRAQRQEAEAGPKKTGSERPRAARKGS